MLRIQSMFMIENYKEIRFSGEPNKENRYLEEKTRFPEKCMSVSLSRSSTVLLQ